MGYIRAEEILPVEVIELIQQYVDGGNIYIPRKAANRQAWGTGTQIRQELQMRNRQIYLEHLAGSKISELASKYYLSEKSIQRIIRNCPKNLDNSREKRADNNRS
ncbi:MAG: CD3324 family protein [bacterium]|nr:CD3324 family protein [bacterium]